MVGQIIFFNSLVKYLVAIKTDLNPFSRLYVFIALGDPYCLHFKFNLPKNQINQSPTNSLCTISSGWKYL